MTNKERGKALFTGFLLGIAILLGSIGLLMAGAEASYKERYYKHAELCFNMAELGNEMSYLAINKFAEATGCYFYKNPASGKYESYIYEQETKGTDLVLVGKPSMGYYTLSNAEHDNLVNWLKPILYSINRKVE